MTPAARSRVIGTAAPSLGVAEPMVIQRIILADRRQRQRRPAGGLTDGEREAKFGDD